MLGLVIAAALAQGPGSTLETRPAAPSSLTPMAPASDLQAKPVQGLSGSTLQLTGKDDLVRKVKLIEGQAQPCEVFATQWKCDDPTLLSFDLKNEPLVLSGGGPTIVPHFVFTALKAGRTTCSCGVPRNHQLVYDFTVISLEDAVRPVVRKVVGAAFSRLYTQRRSQVP